MSSTGQRAVRRVGEAIHGLRTARGLSLRDLAATSGLSAGYLSQVERGLAAIAITTLGAVADALDTDLAYFFARRDVDAGADPVAKPLPHVTRAGEGVVSQLGSRDRTFCPLSTPSPRRALEPLHVVVRPTDRDDPASTHPGEEFCHVLAGALVYVVDGTEHRLGAGDSIHVASTVAHAIRNDGDVDAEAIWVRAPALVGGPRREHLLEPAGHDG